MPPHNLASALVAAPVPRAERYAPDQRAYEAFSLGDNTRLLDPLEATSLNDALAETTSRWSWDRGDRLGIRELGDKTDLLHIYAARRKSTPNYTHRGYQQHREFGRWLEPICTIDLNVVAGINPTAVGCEIDLHQRRQRQRPEGATRGTAHANNVPVSNHGD